jgi:hypothetical protein
MSGDPMSKTYEFVRHNRPEVEAFDQVSQAFRTVEGGHDRGNIVIELAR